jgi:hypothetical protein
MRMVIGLGIATGLGWALAFIACGQDNKCRAVDCDYTHVRVDLVDASGDETSATKVTYTVHPFDDAGVLMSEDELDDAGIDVDKSYTASCGSDDEDDCSIWIAAAGFGEYTFTATVAADEDTGQDYTTKKVICLPPPDSSDNESCCGIVDSREKEIVVDPDAASDTGDTGQDTGIDASDACD